MKPPLPFPLTALRLHRIPGLARTHASFSLQLSKQQNSAPNNASTVLACEYSVQLQLLAGPSSFDHAVLPETDTSHLRMLSLLEVSCLPSLLMILQILHQFLCGTRLDRESLSKTILSETRRTVRMRSLCFHRRPILSPSSRCLHHRSGVICVREESSLCAHSLERMWCVHCR